MEKKREYQNLDVIDILCKIAYGWRLVLVTALCVMVLCGVYGVYSSIKTNKAVDAEWAEVEELNAENKKNESLTEQDKALVQQAIYYHKYLNRLADSIYNEMDVEEIDAVVYKYIIKAADQSVNSAVDYVSGYMSYIDKLGFYDDVTKKMNSKIEKKFLMELIKAEVSNASIYKENDPNAFEIVIYGRTAEEAKEVASAVKSSIADYSSKISKSIGSHELILMDTFEGKVVDVDEDIIQPKERDERTAVSVNTQLVNVIKGFNQKQIDLYNEATGESIEAVQPEAVQPEAVQVSLTNRLALYLSIGFILGIIVGCGLIVVCYTLNGKIKTADELSKMFSVYLFGDFVLFREHNKMFSRVDRFIDKLRNKEGWTLDDEQKLTLTNIGVVCKNKSVEKVYVTSTLPLDSKNKNIALELVDGLKEKGIQAEYGDYVIRNAQTMADMASVGKVIFVEKLNGSKYESIDKALDIAIEQGTEVLGVVTV